MLHTNVSFFASIFAIMMLHDSGRKKRQSYLSMKHGAMI